MGNSALFELILFLFVIIVHVVVLLIAAYKTITAKGRRRKSALETAKEFLVSKKDNKYSLMNKNVVVAYNAEEKILNFWDRRNSLDFATARENNEKTRNDFSDRSVVIDFYNRSSELREYDRRQDNIQENNLMDLTFDMLCGMFDSFTTFNVIESFVSRSYKLDYPNRLKQNKEVENSKEEIKNTPKTIDINNASQEDLAKLRGINIILAKKIVRYRDLNHGFKTIEEFFKFINLKSHFVEQIRPLIEIKDYNVNNKSKTDTSSERTVDF